MRIITGLAVCLSLLLSLPVPAHEPARASEEAHPELTTIALRCHRTEAMVAFYNEAFGFEFREVETFGIRSRFGTLGRLTLKLVPLRENEDFVSYPSHQLGFTVPDVGTVIALAERHGGRQEGELRREDGRLHAAIRDPDGNTVELYGLAPN